jgi:hypothetical protein
MSGRKPKLEDEYFKILSVWRRAAKDPSYSEAELKTIFLSLERAFRVVGYEFGDRPSDGAQDAPNSHKNAAPLIRYPDAATVLSEIDRARSERSGGPEATARVRAMFEEKMPFLKNKAGGET